MTTDVDTDVDEGRVIRLDVDDTLSANSYKIKSSGVSEISICGSDELATLRGLQCFYSKAVVNGNFIFPQGLDVAVTISSIRDAAVTVYQNKYYTCANNGQGYSVYVSENMLNWTKLANAFDASACTDSRYQGFKNNGEAQAAFAENADFYAPEVHEYGGYYYLFASYRHKTGNYRGTAIFRASTPAGPFEPWSNGFITPSGVNCIDGTLYVENGTPYMVYSVEFINFDAAVGGNYSYVQLKDDLSGVADGAGHTKMFDAKEAHWSRISSSISDAPWLYRCEDGTLLMLWSNKDENGNYFVSVSKSSNGTISGDWSHERLLYSSNATNSIFDEYRDGDSIYTITDGGHAMVFKSLEGRLYLSLHTVNDTETTGLATAATVIPIVEKNGMLYLDLLN